MFWRISVTHGDATEAIGGKGKICSADDIRPFDGMRRTGKKGESEVNRKASHLEEPVNHT
jgi:hypothetical protein